SKCRLIGSVPASSSLPCTTTSCTGPLPTTCGGMRFASARPQASLNPPGLAPTIRAMRSRLAKRLVTIGVSKPLRRSMMTTGVPRQATLLQLQDERGREIIKLDRFGDTEDVVLRKLGQKTAQRRRLPRGGLFGDGHIRHVGFSSPRRVEHWPTSCTAFSAAGD